MGVARAGFSRTADIVLPPLCLGCGRGVSARLLEYVNARYTAGPRERLEKLPKVWQFAAVEVVV